ncbi:alpha/beta hydrolase fold protein [Trametes versicolor FP-101664 SS1]|uniref:alpha/beta hydrolase fold protein n=1 Tax=Trametes versicolor (strain FP-101664) TaxID=717944 RepID=UPI0004623B31|nr:alpha/beta hydrolase fold protein [Trametes versicolor FP-101664 SS1]EIW59224.1 alpha/beta hydrolase fold protein [Trametes versicolor FP-101664 SS1]
MAAPTQVKTITVDNGIDVFYREAVPVSSQDPSALPVVLLLHGFPSSSFQYRDLIPRLAHKYRVIAPDLPGYGFTVVPEARKYEYTFASITTTIISFLDALKIAKFAVYVFDYGAPTAFRLALQRPEAITALITQNGNAYVEGLGASFWAPLQDAWANPTPEKVKALYAFLDLATTKSQYVTGSPDPSVIPPEVYYLDYYLMTRPGNADIQVGLFLDYKNNVALYPEFHKYFRTHRPPTLAVWGKNDQIFVPAGAEAFKKDLPDAVIKFVDAGHFALETALDKISGEILTFLARVGI